MRYASAGLTLLAAGTALAPAAEAHGCGFSDPFCPRTVIVPAPQFFAHPGPVLIHPRAVRRHQFFVHPGPVFVHPHAVRRPHFFVRPGHAQPFFFHSPHRVPHGTMKFHHRRF